MKQQGAALVIVMALLSGALILGVSGMNSALIDERLAGNYRASVQAKMTSEGTLATFSNIEDRELHSILDRALNGEFEEPLIGEEVEKLLGKDGLEVFFRQLLPSNYEDLTKKEKNDIRNALIENFVLAFELLGDNQIAVTAKDEGLRNSARGSSKLIYSYNLAADDSWENRRRGIHACEKIGVTGSALLDSYDSEAGAYGGGNRYLSGMELRTWLDSSVISASSSAPIYGSIFLPGDFSVGSSGDVYGDIYAGRNINLDNGGFVVYGDITAQNNIFFKETAKIYGNVYSGNNIEIIPGGSLVEGEEVEAAGKVTLNGGADIDAVLRANGGVVFNNYDSQVFSDVYSPSVTLNTNNSISGHILGELYQESTVLQLIEDLISYDNVDDCDVYDVASIYEQYAASEASQGDLYIDGSPQNKKITFPGDDERFYGGEDGEKIMKVNDFSLAGNRELYFGEEGESNDFVVLVDGDLNINGYNSKLYISDGSTVTFVVKGRVDVVGQVSNSSAQGVVDRNGQTKSVMNIVSLYDDRNKADAGVRIRNSKFYADILAPLSRVEFANEAAYGAVYGREVSVLDYGGYHFDEAINVEVDESCQSESEEGCSGQNSGVNSFTLIDWQ